MSQSDMKVTTSANIQIHKDKVGADITYEVREPSSDDFIGAVAVRLYFAEDDKVTIEELRTKAEETARNLLSRLVSHHESNP